MLSHMYRRPPPRPVPSEEAVHCDTEGLGGKRGKRLYDIDETSRSPPSAGANVNANFSSGGGCPRRGPPPSVVGRLEQGRWGVRLRQLGQRGGRIERCLPPGHEGPGAGASGGAGSANQWREEYEARLDALIQFKNDITVENDYPEGG